MRYPPLHGPILKVHNAERHIGYLEQLFGRLEREQFFYLALEDDPEDSAKQVLQIREKGFFPANFALALGDAIHNLRSALDLMACDLAALNEQSVESVYFPIAKSESDLPKLMKSKNFTRTSSEAQRLLLDLKPYTGGTDQLRILHDLDITDKHQLIIPMVASVVVQQLHIVTPEGGRRTEMFCTYSAGMAWKFSKGSTVNSEGLKPHIYFPLDMPNGIGGMELFQLLHNLAQLVRGIIISFAALYGINPAIQVMEV